jgi:DNA-binding CsgD family transcriptional regulator
MRSLTKREREILGLCSSGLRSQEIADKLGIAKRTVDFHLQNVFNKLGVRNRIEALRASEAVR